MNYKILEENSIERLEELVNDFLKEGWVLAGGVAVSNFQVDNGKHIEMRWIYTQAIVKPASASVEKPVPPKPIRLGQSKPFEEQVAELPESIRKEIRKVK